MNSLTDKLKDMMPSPHKSPTAEQEVHNSDNTNTRIDPIAPLKENPEDLLAQTQDKDAVNPHAPNLHVPSDHDASLIKPPEILTAQAGLRSQTDVPEKPKRGIEVVATRKGFYNQMRFKEGDRFFIRSFDEIGEWMQATDHHIEKKRVAMIKEKKARK